MWQHYLKITWRNLTRSKVFSFINIFGLSIGLTCSILILLFVKDEVSFDKFHQHQDQIYRVTTESTARGATSITGLVIGPKFARNVPGIKAFVRYQQAGTDVKIGTDIEPLRLFRADPNFFSVFSFPLIAGNPLTCLLAPNSIVLSRDEAIRQFGSTNIIGKTVQLKNDSSFTPYTVTAVAENCPKNSSIRFPAIAPLHISKDLLEDNEKWFSASINTFLLLEDHADPIQVQKSMQAFFVKDASATFTAVMKKYGIKEGDFSLAVYHLQPLPQMHLDEKISSGNGIVPTSDPTYSYILSGIALFILLIACINFVNLTVARSIKRAREIGIRKVVGSTTKELIRQFMGESMLLCLIAFILAILLTEAFLPLFNTLAGKSLSLSYLFDTQLTIELIVLFFLTSFIAGFYPAIVLSRLDPTQTLYNRFQMPGKNYLQRGLIVTQFVLASFLLVLTFVLYNQFNFLTEADLGYDDSNLVVVNTGNSGNKASVFQKLLTENPNIVTVSAKNAGNNSIIGKVSNGEVLHFRMDDISANYLQQLKIPMVTGRGFSSSHPADSINSVLVNEAFVKKAGWNDPLGQPITFTTQDNKVMQVIGVVKNYHYASMNENIEPQIFKWGNLDHLGAFYIKVRPQQISSSLDFIKKTYQQLFPMSPYSYEFKEAQNKMLYGDIAKWRQILLWGAVITIFISFMGLFGLSILASERRKKEIGIRKVYGASVRSIIQLLTTDYLKLVVFALLIATPLTYMAAKLFLSDILYKIPLTPELFIIPDIMVLLLAFLTVYIQTRQSATTNPVKSLKSE